MKIQSKILLMPLMLALLMCVSACGGEEGEDASALPSSYVFGEETVDVVVPAADTECAIEQTDEHTVYTYEPLAVPGGSARLYYDMILKPETGFSLVDENGYISQDMPDFTQPEGMAQYARESQQKGKKLLLRTEWKEKTCTVILEMSEGSVTDPPGDGMTLDEALEFFCTISPSELGLEGATMEEYDVYAAEGAAFVQGVPCQRIQVYSKENLEQTNHLVGTFLMNGDGTRLYRVNEDETVTAIW